MPQLLEAHRYAGIYAVGSEVKFHNLSVFCPRYVLTAKQVSHQVVSQHHSLTAEALEVHPTCFSAEFDTKQN